MSARRDCEPGLRSTILSSRESARAVSFALVAALAACAHAPAGTDWTANQTYGPIGFASGVSASVLSGKLGQPELYTIRVTIEKGGIMPPHTHPDTRMMTVLEGEVYYGMGETIDLASAPLYKAGDFFIVPGGAPHYASAATSSVVYQNPAWGRRRPRRCSEKAAAPGSVEGSQLAARMVCVRTGLSPSGMLRFPPVCFETGRPGRVGPRRVSCQPLLVGGELA
ncbi:MAG: cupin domain-containing protein [Hyphomonadaceae bacterium]